MELLEWVEGKKNIEVINAELESRRRLHAVLYVALICLILFITAMVYTASAKTVYFWDNSTYWDMARAIVSGELKGKFFSSVYSSILSGDYNYAAALLPALWMKIFGVTRMSYVAGLTVMFLIPSVILTYHLSAKLSKAPWLSLAIAVFMIPSTIFAAVSGYADVGGMLIALACYNLYYSKNKDEGSWLRYVGIGVLLVIITVYRRYFEFFSISFLTAMIIDSIIFKRSKRNVIITVATAAIVLLAVLMPFTARMLSDGYVGGVTGYGFRAGEDLRFVARYFGGIFIAAAFAVPVVLAVRKRDYRPVFAWVQLVLSCGMFMISGSYSAYNIILYAPAFTVLAIFMVNCITNRVMLALVILLMAANAVSPYIKRDQPSDISQIKSVAALPAFSMRPETRGDIQEILKAKRLLDKLVPEDAKCGVIASSTTINAGILRNIEPSVGVKADRDEGYIVSLPDVDARDYARLDEIYDAEYILIAVPPQLHLAKEEQTIVTEAVNSFVNNTDIAQVFEQAADYSAKIGDVELRLYHRVKDMDMIREKEYQNRLYSAK